ncbi:Structural maintenance of chromosomes protein 4 [Elsinoe australis]|uniref:lytic cellulose monooxygenase (C4-dehydrogenating) n=1 Tax=Elsinoe australis TaxID=40998 RepID=A0A2P8A7X4_9PEZI|nr:Structural maintenance of chromosomes protein 4 [Elsinoe australis]
MICHIGATPGQTSIKANAGDEVTLHWTEWPRLHPGPVITYLANCNGDCKTIDKTKLKFTKIDEDGLHSAKPMHWATDTLIDNNNTWVMKLPTDMAAGNYVLRHEIIALQGADNVNGAQCYPSCINFEVTGPGPKTYSEGTSPTTFYDAKDPGIKILVFYDATKNYTIPGPALGLGAGGSAPSAPAPAPSSDPPTPSTTSKVPQPTPAPPSSSAAPPPGSPSGSSAPPSTTSSASAAPAPSPEDVGVSSAAAPSAAAPGPGQTYIPPNTLPANTEAPLPSTSSAPEVPPTSFAPVEPVPTTAVSSEPVPTQPVPSEPALTEPAPTEPAPSQPPTPTTPCTNTETMTLTRTAPPTGTSRSGRGSRRYRQMYRKLKACVARGNTMDACVSAIKQQNRQRAQRAQRVSAARGN